MSAKRALYRRSMTPSLPWNIRDGSEYQKKSYSSSIPGYSRTRTFAFAEVATAGIR
jgi:hypothetical protein